MHHSKVVFLTSILSAFASAQYSIDPSSVPLSTRDVWCNSQETQCPLICLQYPGNSDATDANTCDSTALTYSCICSNGIAPNASQYSQTLPYFICTEWGTQCVAACGSDNACSSDCRSNHPCGAQDPVRVNSTTSSAAATSTAAGSAGSASSSVPAGATVGASGTIYTGFGGAAATSSAAATATGAQSSGAEAALRFGQAYGVVAVVAGLFGGFALLL